MLKMNHKIIIYYFKETENSDKIKSLTGNFFGKYNFWNNN